MKNPKDIFSHFSDNARQVLSSSQKISETMKTGIGSEHILLALLVTSGNLAHEILRNYMVNVDQIRLIIRFNNIRSVHGKGLSSEAKKILEKAVEHAAKLKHKLVEPEHLLWAIINSKDCLGYQILTRIGINLTSLNEQVNDILNVNSEISDFIEKQIEMLNNSDSNNTQGNIENIPEGFIFSGNPMQNPGFAQKTQTQYKKSDTPMLDHFGEDLTKMAKNKKIDPIIGREPEITRMIQILSRRNKNNPVLVGDPGIGKTAIVEGLAQKISDNKVPPSIQNKKLISLDLALMVAGTMYRGQFEERLKRTIAEIKKNKNIIIFLDEIHSIVGSGSAEGSMDTANILKPALQKGYLRMIGATTQDEYRKYIEKDAALERRLQPIKVSEPTAEETINILEGIKSKYEQHHKVRISNDAIKEAVYLAKRYLNERFFPDKAIDIIDEASAAIQITHQYNKKSKKQTELEEKLRNILNEKETQAEKQNYEIAAKLKTEELKLRYEIDCLNKGKSNSDKIVDTEDIAKTISLWTGIPLHKLIKKEKAKIQILDKTLKQKIIGQDEAVNHISKAIKRSKTGIGDPQKPIGAFIFLGPTGVGKTELARVLATELFGSVDSMIKIDMSEFMEKHNLARLVGAPPGYIGYEDAGKLTEAVRKKPYSLILLDEIEKAHPEVFNILLQILEDGYLTDAKGKKVNFRNTLIIMTSNIGTHKLSQQAALGFNTKSKDDKDSFENKYNEMKKQVVTELKKEFKPELINRLDKIIVFKSLDKDSIKKIASLRLIELKNRLLKEKILIHYDNNLVDYIAEKGYSKEYGARPIKRTITELLENNISDYILENNIDPKDIIKIYLDKNVIKLKKVKA